MIDSQTITLFNAALKLPPEGREKFVRNSGDSARVRSEVLRLIAEERSLGDVFEIPAMVRFASLFGDDDEGFRDSFVGPYRILREIGRGGMGVVFEAEGPESVGRVALKVMHDSLVGDARAAERFAREAEIVRDLRHPGVVRVLDASVSAPQQGVAATPPYIAMEFVEGHTLDAVLKSVPLGAERTRRVVEIIAEVADALAAAHDAGVIHRDIKPSNILISNVDGRCKLTDFGIARLDQPDLTQTRVVMGTVSYMSPEQAAPGLGPLDGRTDLYSLGVVLFESISGRKLFAGSSSAEVLYAARHLPAPQLKSVPPFVDSSLSIVCERMLEKRPQDRYPSAASVAADLRNWFYERPVLVRPKSWQRKSAGWVRRHFRLVSTAMILMVVTSAIAAGFVRYRGWSAERAWLTVSPSDDWIVSIRRPDPTTLHVTAYEELGFASEGPFALEPGIYHLSLRSGDDEIETVMDLDSGPVTFSRVGVPTQPDVSNMILIPAGDYVLGAEDRADSEGPRRVITLSAYYIDRDEVTNAEYAEFLDATGHPEPILWQRFGRPDGFMDLPVATISFDDAVAYARFRGKRLPTAAEWEAAVRGPGGPRYPWGDDRDPPAGVWEPDCSVLRLTQDHGPDLERRIELFRELAAENVSRSVPFGLRATQSGVTELTSTPAPGLEDTIVIKGGSWSDISTRRDVTRLTAFPRTRPIAFAGIRCVVASKSGASQGDED